jgi:hypothetical protein
LGRKKNLTTKERPKRKLHQFSGPKRPSD